ncbi:MauE/DoxX family redox-associated membrane protein [Micromonospora sonneratiae]|uniref:MauE/DoxX family redox-associated membrane protein n=1 Tax=Micromonospora sonneratiae TaxID=1184706 RepID=A0ABW3YF66_9ACTN
MAYVELAGRCLLGLVFLVAVTGKLRSRTAFDDFVASVAQFGLLPERWLPLTARLVLTGEAGIVLLLALPATVPAGYALAIGVLGILSAGMLTAVRRGRRPACLCFGAAGVPIGARHVARNLLLAAIAAGGLVASVATSGSPMRPAAALLAVATAVPLAALVVRLDDIVELFTASPVRAKPPVGPSGR